MVSDHETPETPLEKISSNTVPTSERNDGEKIHAPIEAHTASGPTMLAEETGLTRSHPEKSMLIFKRLRKELPLPGRKMIYLMTATMWLVFILAGWNDASQGPLLPSLQAIYNVDYLVISTIWICNFVGFLTSACLNVYLSDHIGFGLAAPFGTSMQALAYCLMLWGPPFPLFVIAYLFNGFGLGLQDAQLNSLIVRFPDPNVKMFLLHAFYGLGATISPLVSTEFVKKVPDRVYLYFAVSLGLAGFIIVLLLVVFRLRTEDQVVGKREVMPAAESATSGHREEEKEEEGSGSKMKRIMKTPAVHAMAFYLAIYVGVEVTLGGWITTFLVTERGGDDNAGYVTTGYFAGITLGRVILIPVTGWIGKNNSIYVYTIICIILEVIIWTVPHLISNSVLYSLIGILLGPMYPVVMMTVLDVMPPELQGGTIGWAAAMGQAGSALMPFITGGISNKYGPWVLQPIVIAFLACSLALWFIVPRPKGWIA